MSDTPVSPEGTAPAAAPTNTVRVALDELRSIAAEAAGLSPELAARLQGSNLTELVTDARSLAAAVKPPEPAAPETPSDATQAVAEATPRPEDGVSPYNYRRELPQGGHWTRESIRELGRTNPRKLNQLLESGQIDLRRIA